MPSHRNGPVSSNVRRLFLTAYRFGIDSGNFSSHLPVFCDHRGQSVVQRFLVGRKPAHIRHYLRAARPSAASAPPRRRTSGFPTQQEFFSRLLSVTRAANSPRLSHMWRTGGTGTRSSSKPTDRKSTRLNSSHSTLSRMPSSA